MMAAAPLVANTMSTTLALSGAIRDQAGKWARPKAMATARFAIQKINVRVKRADLEIDTASQTRIDNKKRRNTISSVTAASAASTIRRAKLQLRSEAILAVMSEL